MHTQIGGLLLGNLPHVVAVSDGDVGVGRVAEHVEVVLGGAVSVVHELALVVYGVAVDIVVYVRAGNAHAAPYIGGGAGVLGVLILMETPPRIPYAGGVYAAGAARGAGGACAAANNPDVIRAEVAGVALLRPSTPFVCRLW